jgi:acetyl esterase/lipase
MRYLGFVLGLALLVSSCSKKDVGTLDGPSADSLPASSYQNVSYGSDAQQKLDVYLPANRNNKTRLLIIIHGGGWSAGDKSDFNNYITEFQNRLPGYAFANLNYRLVTKDTNFFPTQENDIASAITFLRDKSAEYKISQNFVYLGISAGAHLALLQAYKHSDILQPRGIVSFFGPADLVRLYMNNENTVPDAIKNVMNATLEEDPNIFYESSPINYVGSNSAPTLMLHGDKDNVVPVEQAYLLRDKLQEFNVTNKLVVYPGQGHGWFGDDLQDSFLQVQNFIRGLEN